MKVEGSSHSWIPRSTWFQRINSGRPTRWPRADLNTCSRSYCQEKEVTNHVLRAFINAHAKAIARSAFPALSIQSVLICPLWSHTLRFIHHFLLSFQLPDPELYSLQVKTKIRLHVRPFVHTRRTLTRKKTKMID